LEGKSWEKQWPFILISYSSGMGRPLVLKRDNGSNLNHQAVDEVLARYLVLPLKSPPHYPPYNGAIECAVRELVEKIFDHASVL
jgi:hypothetical protein